MKNKLLAKSILIVVILIVVTGLIQYKLNGKTDSAITSSDVATEKEADMTNGVSEGVVDNADITIQKVKGMPSDFIRGIDMSEVVAQEKSGVRYFDKNGMEKDVFQILSESGINYVKLRVWNDPYDSNHNSYGGGNCDLNNAIAIAKRTSKYGIKLMINFQYSDFWANDYEQRTPKAWREMSFEQKTEAVYSYTQESLLAIQKAGGLIGMVQIGNETNSGFIGETKWEKMAVLMNIASSAVREFAHQRKIEIKVVLDFANPDEENLADYAKLLDMYNVDYDVFATTYYSCWNGTLKNLTKQLKKVSLSFGKEVMVGETSYPYTLLDTDGMENSVYDEALLAEGYPADVQGQAKMIRDTIEAVVKCGESGIGVMYADGAWTSVGSDYNANVNIWETYGSGWKSQYAASYDEDIDAKTEGSDVDNEAFFDRRGKVLTSINAFAYAYSGSKTR